MEHSSAAVILTGGILHCLVFLYAALCKLQPELQYLGQFRRSCLYHFRHIFLSEGLGFDSLFRQESFQLRYGVWILKVCQLLHLRGQICIRDLIHLDCLLYKLTIDHNAAIVDHLVEMILIPDKVRNRVVLQPLLYLHFDFHIALIILLEQFPLLRRELGKIPGPSSIGFGRLAGVTEIPDQVLAFFELLLLEPQGGTNPLKSERKSVISSQYHGAFP